MVVQKVIRVNEPFVEVRSRRGKTYQCVVNPDISLARILGYLSQGFDVDAHVEFPHDTATIVGILAIPPVHTWEEQDLEQNTFDEHDVFADY
jgi:hypothetical protein